MRKFPLYLKLIGTFALSLVMPTSALTSRVERLLAQLKDEASPGNERGSASS